MRNFDSWAVLAANLGALALGAVRSSGRIRGFTGEGFGYGLPVCRVWSPGAQFVSRLEACEIVTKIADRKVDSEKSFCEELSSTHTLEGTQA